MSDDILSRIDEAMARNAARFDPFGPQVPKPEDGTGKEPEEAEAAADLAEWEAVTHIRRRVQYVCRGCRSTMRLDAKLCPECTGLPPCGVTRSAAEWGGVVACFRPAGHDGQHETVEGRCWMDPPRVEVTAATSLPLETRSLECSRSRPMCSGCDGAAAWGSGPCLHECHDEPAEETAPARRSWWKRKRWLP